jgi:hypothetical protein
MLAALSSFPVHAAPSINELVPNGDFEAVALDGKVAVWSGIPKEPNAFENTGDNRVLRVQQAVGALEWDNPGKAIGNTEYIFSFRVKGKDLQGQRLSLWARLPDKHEPPGGAKFSRPLQGTFDWTQQEVRFKMPVGITRFVVFFDGFDKDKGTAWFDDFSLQPVDNTPLELDASAASYGTTQREPLTWIWDEPGFPWQGQNMNKESVQPVPPSEVLFRRSIVFPYGAREAQAVFTGDDFATLSINGREVGGNGMWQNIVRLPLEGVLKPGKNDVVFKVNNTKGPAGLLGRIEWKNAQGARSVLTTNGQWESSADGGKKWKPAAVVAMPPSAPAQFAWAFPHLDKNAYMLQYSLPAGVTSARLAVRSTGSFRILADGAEIWSGSSSGAIAKNDLGNQIKGANKLSLVFEDIAQPPAGQALLQVRTATNQEFQDITLDNFKSVDGSAPKAVAALYPERTWPINIGAFEAAASRPAPNLRGRLEPWAVELLAGSMPLFQIGKDDDSSVEFAELTNQSTLMVDATSTVPETFPRGLESKLLPELGLRFNLAAIPAHGAAFVMDIEDTDANVNTVGVFVNGVLSGSPQILGYDQVPGARLTNRAWIVTIPKERFVVGANLITLRFLPPYYQAAGQEPENQAQEIIQQINLRDRSESPYPTSAWLHWDTLSLAALAQPAAEPVNGRPVWMGTNMGYTHINAKAMEWWNDFVLRDFSYLGMAHSTSPIRYGISSGTPYKFLTATDAPGLAAGQNVGDYQLSSFINAGMRPYAIFDSGRDAAKPEDLTQSHETQVIKRFGKYFDRLEVGNEVDHPYYNWDALRMAMGYATIQRQSAVGQMLKQYDPDKNLKLIGEGWYHAWDFSVMDAHQRQENPHDVAWTDELSAHNYGKSYIIPAVIYYTLYGVNPPKPIWITECGSYTADDERINDFDLNLRGNLAYATNIVQYLAHPYNVPMQRFSLFSAQSKDAKVLEKARSFRRLLHAHALHGKPLSWQYTDAATMKDKLVLVNPVDAGKAYKISLVNLSRDSQPIDVNVTLSQRGALQSMRYGDGETVAAGTRQVTLNVSPNVRFREVLAPGETVEYFIAK